MRILVIEDNPRMASAIQRGLTEQGYVVDVAHTGFEGEERCQASQYDAIVLDLMLPDRDGVELCRSLRRGGLRTPLLMLTALSGTADKVSGLDAGADDYLAKPFEFEELIARVRALLRRGQASESRKLRYDDLELDLSRRSCERSGSKIRLTPKEFSLLEFLMRNPGRVLPRMTIVEKVWDMSYEPASNVIDVYVSQLRKKIDRDHVRPLIHTVVSAGYRFGLAEQP